MIPLDSDLGDVLLQVLDDNTLLLDDLPELLVLGTERVALGDDLLHCGVVADQIPLRLRLRLVRPRTRRHGCCSTGMLRYVQARFE